MRKVFSHWKSKIRIRDIFLNFKNNTYRQNNTYIHFSANVLKVYMGIQMWEIDRVQYGYIFHKFYLLTGNATWKTDLFCENTA